jgi:hypothetical protein
MVFHPKWTYLPQIDKGLFGGKEPMGTQEFVLTMEEKPNYLHVRAGGMRSRETVKAITTKVFTTALKKHLSKILIDVRELIGEFGYMDIYFLVKVVFEDLRGKGVDYLAVVDIQRTARKGWFLEPVAQSRGFNIRVFADEESAMQWLNG